MKHASLAILFVLVLGSVLYLGFRTSQRPLVKYATRGYLDFTNEKNFDEPISLKGQWRFHWKKLFVPANDSSATFINYPSLWQNQQWYGQTLSPEGYGTYSVKLILPSNRPELALEIPDSYSSYALYVDGKLFASNGKPATTKNLAKPFASTQTIDLHPHSDTVNLVLQVANYWHAKGGTYKSIRIGNHKNLFRERERSFAIDLLLTGCLFMGGLFFLGLYLFGKHDKAILYFSLFCILYSYRMIGCGYYALHSLFPESDWGFNLRIEYLSLSLAIALYAKYTMCLFPKEARSSIINGIISFCVLYAVFIICSPPVVFSGLLKAFLLVMFAIIVYALYVYIQAARHQRMGSTYALISTAVLLLIFSILNLNFFGLIPAYKAVVFTGYIAFFFLQSLILSHRFAHKLKKAAFQAEQGLQAKSEFLSTISHEIRTPLNAVIGMTHLLLYDNPRDDQKENMDVLLFSANNLLSLVNDILDYNKIEAGKINLEQIPMDVPFIAMNIINGLKEVAQEKQINLLLEVDSRLTHKLMGDPTRLGQVMNNLVQNALKFTNKGFVRLSIKVVRTTSETITLTIGVEDTGIGISEDKQKLIFERFTQADSSTSRSYGGTGLGLAICKNILELQGAKLQLKSEPGKGSLFYFTQTFFISKDSELIQEQVINSDRDRSILDGSSILLVEDNPFNIMVAQKMLENLGVKIDVAHDGKEALELFDHDKHQLILMDLHMSVMDGFESSSLLRKRGETVPIIALTASMPEEVKEEIFAAGLTDIVLKPFNPDDLYTVIAKYLKKSK